MNAAEKKDETEFYPAKRTDVAPVRLGCPVQLIWVLLAAGLEFDQSTVTAVQLVS